VTQEINKHLIKQNIIFLIIIFLLEQQTEWNKWLNFWSFYFLNISKMLVDILILLMV